MTFKANGLRKLLRLGTLNLFGMLMLQIVNVFELNVYIKTMAYVFEIMLLLYVVIAMTHKTYLKVEISDILLLKELSKSHEFNYENITVKLKGLFNKRIEIKHFNKKYYLYSLDYKNLDIIFDTIERRKGKC